MAILSFDTPLSASNRVGWVAWIFLIWILVNAAELSVNGARRGGIMLAEASLTDHKTMIYTLPRPGVLETDDCYTDNYSDDIKRDLSLMNELGVTTIMTFNGWNFGRSHATLLTTMASYNMSLGITFKPDLDGVMRKNLEKLQKTLSTYSVALEFLYLDYPLDFDNAEEFFRWVIQVRSWMYQENLNCPLLLRFFPQVSNPKTVQVLLQQWDEGDFTAWVVEAYSTNAMLSWLTTRMLNNKKQIFFLYGADTWTMNNSTEDIPSQEPQIKEMLDFLLHGEIPASQTTVDGNSTANIANATDHLLSGALQGYSDAWFLGSGENYFQGGAKDVCPDKNPYLHTSCGGNDNFISYGDKYYSVEHMGVFKHYETIYYFRCVEPTPTSSFLQQLWNPNANPAKLHLSKPTCSLSVSVPTIFVFYLWAAGLAVSILGLLLGCCKATCCSSSPSSSSCCTGCCCRPRRSLPKPPKQDKPKKQKKSKQQDSSTSGKSSSSASSSSSSSSSNPQANFGAGGPSPDSAPALAASPAAAAAAASSSS